MTIDELKQSVRGSVITTAGKDYGSARKALIWNGREPNRAPSIIVRAESVADVQAVVRYARSAGLKISVRGGGHNWSGIALQEGIVLDLSQLSEVKVDAEARIAEVGVAARNGDFARILGAHGLAFPTGHCTSVPLSGYLLGGGFGWNAGAWGVACFGIESLQVVTADGNIRRASESENPEIFWAARGGGPEFFGVVTAYTLKLQSLPRAITTSLWTYPIERVSDVERWVSGAMREAPATVEFTTMFSSAPLPLAGRASKVVSGIATVFADTDGEARQVLERIAALAPEGAIDVQQFLPTPFDVLYDIIGQFFPEGRRYAVDSFWSSDAGALMGGLAQSVARSSSPETFALAVVLPPPPPGGLPDAAFSMVGPVFGCAYGVWQNPREDDANIGWLKETGEAVAPTTLGHYVGEAYLDDPSRLRGSFSPAAWARLKKLQAKYDPDGMLDRASHEAASERPKKQASEAMLLAQD